MSTLIRIKELVINGDVLYTRKADLEMARDHLTRGMIQQAIISAPIITKTIRSRSPVDARRELLYIIIGMTYSGLVIYTKGKILQRGGKEYFYVIISSKKNIQG